MKKSLFITVFLLLCLGSFALTSKTQLSQSNLNLVHSTVNNKTFQIRWNHIAGVEKYYLYHSTEEITSTSALSAIDSTTTNALDYDLSDASLGKHYFSISYKNDGDEIIEIVSNLSLEITPNNDGSYESKLETALKTKAIEALSHTLINTEEIVRDSTDGYDLNDIRLSSIEKDGDIYLRIENHTPRRFADVNFVLNNTAFSILERVDPFSTKEIDITDKELTLEDEFYVLEPNSAYNPNVAIFGGHRAGGAHTQETIRLYQVI